MNEERKYYVYHWINDQINQPFYVGKGCGDRYKRTGKGHRNIWFMRYINKHKCHPQVIISNLSQKQAFEKQIQTIRKYKQSGYTLCNLTQGGEGSPHPVITEEYRAKYRQMLKGQNNPNYGNKWTDQQRKHLSELKKSRGDAKGSNNPRAYKVMCVQTGQIFGCQRQAARSLGLQDGGSINHALKQRRFVAKGFHFVSGDLIVELSTKQKRNQYLNSI